MRKFLLIIFLGLILIFGILIALFFRGSGLQNATKPMNWGVVVRPYALAEYNANVAAGWRTSIDDQLLLAKELGSKVVRVNLEYQDDVNAHLINEAHRQGLDIMLVLERPGDNPVTNKEVEQTKLYDLGYQLGYNSAQTYLGKIKYYQLANEVTGNAIKKPEDTGETLPNRFNLYFDKIKYERVRDYVSGLADGVRAADPGAKRFVTGNWVLVDIIKYLIDDNVDFEAVGWDWYSDMGLDPRRVQVEQFEPLDIPATITTWGKEFWLVEVNQDKGSFQGEATQAEFLEKVADISLDDPHINGFIVHELPDGTRASQDPDSFRGIVEVSPATDSKTATFSRQKLAFGSLKSIFTTNPNKISKLSFYDQLSRLFYDFVSKYLPKR